MATIEAFDSYLKYFEPYDNSELRDFIEMHRNIFLELQTEDEQARYFEYFIKELNLFFKDRINKQ